MPDPLRLLLVDDHYLVRLGLSSVIALEPDMTVCAEAATGRHAIDQFRAHKPDVTLMDLRLPDLSGTDAIRAIRAEYPDAKIIALSTFAGDEEIHMALEAGALAYLVKTVQPEELVDTIRKVADGPAARAARSSPPVSPCDRHARTSLRASSMSSS